MDLIKRDAAHKVGPGGIKCACCRPGRRTTKKEAQVLLNRRARRTARTALKAVAAQEE